MSNRVRLCMEQQGQWTMMTTTATLTGQRRQPHRWLLMRMSKCDAYKSICYRFGCCKWMVKFYVYSFASIRICLFSSAIYSTFFSAAQCLPHSLSLCPFRTFSSGTCKSSERALIYGSSESSRIEMNKWKRTINDTMYHETVSELSASHAKTLMFRNNIVQIEYIRRVTFFFMLSFAQHSPLSI